MSERMNEGRRNEQRSKKAAGFVSGRGGEQANETIKQSFHKK